MGILFKLKNRNKRKIIKRQEGGTIPVYGTFQVQHAQNMPYNPASLLARYQSSGPPTAASTTGAAKVPESSIPELKGLSNDVTALGDEIAGMEARYAAGGAGNPAFASSPEGQRMRYNIDMATSIQLQKAVNSKAAFDEALPIMRDRLAEGTPVYKDGKFLAQRWLQDDNGNWYQDYEKITFEDLRDDAQGWRALNYSDLSELRATSMDEKFLFTGKFGESAARDISYGMGMEWIENELLDKNYTNLGESMDAWEEKQGGQVTKTGAILKEYGEGRKDVSNETQLKVALSKIKSYLGGANSPAMNSLLGHFLVRSASKEEAQERLDRYLAAHMAQQLGYSTDKSKVEIWETPEERAIKGSSEGGGPLAPLSPYVTEVSEATGPVYIHHEKGKGFQDGKSKTQNVMTLVAWEAPTTTQLIDPANTMDNQNTGKAGESGSFAMAGNINQATDGEGRPLKGLKTDWGSREGEKDFLSVAMPSANQTIRVTRVPIGSDGKVLRAALDDIEKMNEKIAALEKEMKEKDVTRDKVNMWKSYQAKIEAVKQEFLSKPEYKGVTLQPRYLVDVVYMDPENSSNMEDIGNITQDDIDNYTAKFGQENGPADNISVNLLSGIAQGDNAVKHYLRKTTIMVPTADLVKLQHLGATVYAVKNNLTGTALTKDETYRRYKNVDENALYQALKAKFSDEHDGYNTWMLRSLENIK